MGGYNQNQGRQNGQASGKKPSFKQKAAMAIVNAVEGKGSKPQPQQRKPRPGHGTLPPEMPLGQPSRHSTNSPIDFSDRGFSDGIGMPQGRPQRSSSPVGRQPSKSGGQAKKPQQPKSPAQRQQPPRPKAPPQRQQQAQRSPLRPTQQRQQPTQRPPQRPSQPGQRQPRRPMTPQEKRQYAARMAYIRKKKQQLKRLKIGAGAAVFCIIMLILSLTVLFRIDSIIVQPVGEIVYKDAQVQEACGIQYGTVNLFRCDIDKIESDIEKKLPYIGNAVVSRKFPSSITVKATPTLAAAAIDCTTGYLFVDKEGKMLEFTENVPTSILVFKCGSEFEVDVGKYISFTSKSGNGTDTVLALYKDIISAIQKTGIEDITLVDIRDMQQIKLMYQNRLMLYLGTDTMLETKLNTAIKTLKFEDDGSKTKTGNIDLSTIGVAFVDDTEQTTEEASTEPVTENESN